MPDDLDEFLTVAEIADRLKVNQQTVRNWIDRGELSALRIGTRRVRIRASDLERYIADNTAAKQPTEDECRQAYADALAAVDAAGSPDAQAVALRRVARSATRLALVLSD
ncbi:MAG TPA: helix-turn-helix domain-containing protein [Solirubrobacteraceae bacterium]|nr:helix-turn-helix domain-containing protein [Solirubrobacteraceae bacterium]